MGVFEFVKDIYDINKKGQRHMGRMWREGQSKGPYV